MPRVYVIGALLPTGGAYMAYHLGRLLALHFGYELADVAVNELGAIDVNQTDAPIFRYDLMPVASVPIFKLHEHFTEADLLIANPFYSQFLFGHRLPGRKIMYVQDFKTSQLIDGQFDLYVSVSQVVQRYMQSVYGIETPLIPPFIELDAMPEARPWHERPRGSVLVYMKSQILAHKILRSDLITWFEKIAPGLNFTAVLGHHKLPHGEFLRAIASVRYLVNLSLAEGFGLVPLEAMALGTMVTGLDGLAGRDYMRHGYNCLVGSLRNLERLPAVITEALNDEELAAHCVGEGRKTAAHYGYGPFKQAWLAQFAQFLGVNPSHG